MPDTFRRIIKDPDALRFLRGNTGILGDGVLVRDELDPGTYNPVYYSGNPSQGGEYKTNRVGYYGPSSLTTEEEGANVTHSTNGQTFANVNFYRRVSPAATNLTYVNCLFQGTPTDATAPMQTSSAAVNTTFIDCTFAPMAPQYSTGCARVNQGGATFIRCDFYGGIDGLNNGTTNGWVNQVNVIQCAFHDMLNLSPDPNAVGGITDNMSHTDHLQWSGGKLNIDGSGFWGFYDMYPKRWQAPEPNIAFGTGSTTSSANSAKYPYHYFGNKYTDTVNVPGDAHTPPAVIGQPSIYITSNIMFSPIYRNIEFFSCTNSYFDGSSYSLNMGNTEFATTYGGVFAGPFTFSNNHLGTNHRWSVNGTYKHIISNDILWGQMSISNNVDITTGAAVSRTQILQNG